MGNKQTFWRKFPQNIKGSSQCFITPRKNFAKFNIERRTQTTDIGRDREEHEYETFHFLWPLHVKVAFITTLKILMIIARAC